MPEHPHSDVYLMLPELAKRSQCKLEESNPCPRAILMIDDASVALERAYPSRHIAPLEQLEFSLQHINEMRPGFEYELQTFIHGSPTGRVYRFDKRERRNHGKHIAVDAQAFTRADVLRSTPLLLAFTAARAFPTWICDDATSLERTLSENENLLATYLSPESAAKQAIDLLQRAGIGYAVLRPAGYARRSSA